MTKIEFAIEMLTKIRIWEQAEDKRVRDEGKRLRNRNAFIPTELQILFTLATVDPSGIHPKDITIGRLGSFRTTRETLPFDRLEELGYIRKQRFGKIYRYFITDMGMRFVNTVIR